ncbi:MAG: GDSL-type esterase/lipase family protein [Actinomycetota bacterium]|nr:GDSL-type esterase/lipase family protein [Actinomycetota bacterium]
MTVPWRRSLAIGFVFALASAGHLVGAAGPAAAGIPGVHWVGTWSAAEVQPDVTGPSAIGFADQTVREVVRTSIGGSQLRVRLTNVFGTQPLSVAAAEVGIGQSGNSVVPGSNHMLTVGGSASFVIPPGAFVFSDPVGLQTSAGSDVAVSLYFAAPTGPATWHPLALTTTYIAAGEHTADNTMPYKATASSWYFLSGIDTLARATNVAAVALGASSTDGLGSTFAANRRWIDDLNGRLDASDPTAAPSVLNEGISSNRLLSGGGTAGQSGEDRFARDALGQSGARTVIVSSLGNNDIGDKIGANGQAITAAAMIAGYQQLIARAHGAGLTIIGGTITPDQGAYYYTPSGETIRQQVNGWILTSGAFDATSDFAGAVADPTDPARIRPSYDEGDHLHLNDAGYQAMSQSVDPLLLSGDPVADRYQTLGGASSFLGAATGPEQTVGAGHSQAYQGGTIYWSPATGAHEVHGAILGHYLALGGPAGILGYPTSDESPSAGGRLSDFQGGITYWSPATGAYEVHGVILSHYLALGGPAGILGYPISDEQPTRAPGGRFNSFQGGVIDWSPALGAFEVQGAILNRYLSLGGTASFLGFPISDEFQVGPAGRQSNFEHGYISFSFTNGAITVG